MLTSAVSQVGSRRCRRRWTIGAALALLGLLVGAGSASGATYFVDNRDGSGCSNGARGTSVSTPWCDFSPANAHGPFRPGDRLLLARGARWNQELRVTGSGTAARPITLGAYGSGPRPVVERDNGPGSRAVQLKNTDHWQVQELEVAHAAAGVHALFTTPGHQGLVLRDLDVHDNYGIWHCRDSTGTVDPRASDEHLRNSAGIAITGNVETSDDSTAAISDVRVDHVRGTHNFNTVAFDFVDACRQEPVAGARVGSNLIQQVVISDVVAHDDDNPMPGRPGCDEGMRLFTMRHVVLMDSVLDQEGSCYSRTGTTAMILGRLQDVSIVNTIVGHVDATGSPDQGAFDYEYLNDSVRVRNSYLTSLAGDGLSFLQFRPDDFQTRHEASGNVLLDQHAAFRVYATTGTPTGVIRDNLSDSPLFFEQSGTFAGFVTSNNRRIDGGPPAANYAPEQFSSHQGSNGWSYERRAAAGPWTQLEVYDGPSDAWRTAAATGGPEVARFTMQPPCDGGWVARAWTATQSGVISVRGRVLKAHNAPGPAGDGVLARVSLDDQRIWPATGDRAIAGTDEYTGADQVLDDLPVTRGDVLRFEVNAGADCRADVVSWAPAVVYTSGGASVVRDWRWDHRPDREGWTGNRDAATLVGNGDLHISSSGSDPYVSSAAGLGIDAATGTQIRVRLRNSTASTEGRIYFTTTESPTFSEDKSVPFTVDARSAFVEYVVDMTANGAWTGTIDRLRLDPVRAPGTVDVDYFRVTAAPG